MSKEELESAVMCLRAEDRARLAHRLIASIDHDPTGDIEAAWVRAADRRAEDVISGAVEPVPGDEVFRKAFAKRKKK